jgi:5-(carboxyamino)imidazole ribonucleotide mutase
MGKVIVLMGSEKDMEFSQEIAKHLKSFGLTFEFRVASAHKTPEKALSILKESDGENTVYITVAGKSNALSAFVDANTVKPVIACPPVSDKFGGADIFSSLRTPSGIGSVVVIEPEAAAIAAAKIFALRDEKLAKRVHEYQNRKKKEIEKADTTIRRMK